MTDGTVPEPIAEELRALVDAEKVGGGPPSGASERVLLRLAGTIGFGQPPGLPPSGADAAPAPSGLPHVGAVAGVATAHRLLRTAAIFIAGTAAGAGGYHVARRVRETPVSARHVVPGRPEATSHAEGSPAPAAPATVPPPVAPAAPTPPAPPTARPRPSSPSDDAVAAERSLLEIARTALARGQAEGALAALRRHARQFPNGELAEERETLVVQALVGVHKYDLAREKAAQFRKRYPRSLFAPVVDQALQSTP